MLLLRIYDFFKMFLRLYILLIIDLIVLLAFLRVAFAHGKAVYNRNQAISSIAPLLHFLFSVFWMVEASI